MNEQELLKILQAGESTPIEYKEAKRGMPSSLFETVAAFQFLSKGFFNR